MNDSTSIESRFEGHEIIEAGMAQIPNMLIEYYQRLGLSDGQFALLCHILQRKWTKEAPYPSLTGLKMTAHLTTRRRYVRDLRNRGLLFTSRLYWSKEEAEKNPLVIPGRVRSNLWYLGSLLHNLTRIDHWIKEGNSPESFQVEIPLKTVKMFLEGKFHDTPKEIVKAINEQTKSGTVLKAVTLLCQNSTVEPTMPKATSRKATSRKQYRLKEESDSNKNHKLNKNQHDANASPPMIQPSLSTEFTLEPDTPEALLVFEKIKQNQVARGQAGNARRFKSIEQKKKFLAAVARLGPAFGQALNDGLEKGITDLAGLVGWLTGCKAEGKGKKKKFAEDSPPLFPPPNPGQPEPERVELTPEEEILARFKERAAAAMPTVWKEHVAPMRLAGCEGGKIQIEVSRPTKELIEGRYNKVLDPIAQELSPGGFEYVTVG